MILIFRRKKDDWKAIILSDLSRQFITVHFRHHDVQNGKINFLRSDYGISLGSVFRRNYPIAVTLQIELEKIDDILVVLRN